jgi:hypothetical protein
MSYSGDRQFRGYTSDTAASYPTIHRLRISAVASEVGVPKDITDSSVGDAGSPYT